MTESRAETVVEGIYKDMERRISPGHLSRGSDLGISEDVPCPDLRQVRALPGRPDPVEQSHGGRDEASCHHGDLGEPGEPGQSHL